VDKSGIVYVADSGNDRVQVFVPPGISPTPPVASFTFTPASGAAPLTVTFKDTSTGSPVAWIWDFGDGTAGSAAQNPVHQYAAPGTYTVTLTAVNAFGSGTAKKTGAVTVRGNKIVATIDIDPDTLNMKSCSDKNAVTVYIELAGADVTAVDVRTVTLSYAGKTIKALPAPTSVGDYDKDGISDRMVKFNRQEVIGIVVPGDAITLTVNGMVACKPFEGTDTIRVIREGKDEDCRCDGKDKDCKDKGKDKDCRCDVKDKDCKDKGKDKDCRCDGKDKDCRDDVKDKDTKGDKNDKDTKSDIKDKDTKSDSKDKGTQSRK